MSSIFVFSEKSVWFLPFSKQLKHNGFQFSVVLDKCLIKKDNRVLECKDGNSITFDEYRFLFHEEDENWYICSSNICSIGRNVNNDLCIDSMQVSNFHARFVQNRGSRCIQDLDSKNGLYINGERIAFSNVNDFDIIYIADCICIPIKDIFVVNKKISNSIPLIKKGIPQSFLSPKDLYPSTFQFQSINIESPVIRDKPKKGKLFLAIGPAILILFSSGLASLIEAIVSPSSTITITRFISPLCMSFAFMGYGLFNRKSSFAEEMKEHKYQESLYEKYLLDREKEMFALLDEYNQSLKKQREFLTGYKMKKIESIQLYLGVRKETLPIFKYSIPGYQYAQNHLVQKEKELISKGERFYPINCVFHEKEKVWIKAKAKVEYIETLVLQAIQTHTPPKIVVACKCISTHSRIFAFDVCTYKNNPLCIENGHMNSLVQEFLNSDLEYIFISDDPHIIQQISPSSYIYMSTQSFTFPFDFTVEKIDLDGDIELILRSILWQKNSNRKEIESYFVKGKEDRLYLNCCVGLDDMGNEIQLNFEEGIDGPHALVAGMTGSGKSEFLSTLLIGLIVKNKPKYFQYILVDFKGGAFGQAFYEFEHCAGMVTNLEEENLSRLMESLHCEIRNRQLKLQKAEISCPDMTSHVDSYNERMKDKISHLFIIVDEFAQLKMKYPEYLENLKEFARIGRSLGIHLILATQKPMGVVDEQIWSNSTLKVCLKVNSEMDSKEMLHNPKGAYLKNAGDFIAQNMEGEKEGRAFYLKQEIQEGQHWQEVGKQSCTQKEETLFTKLSKRIPKGNQKWILLPPLSEKMKYEENQWGWMDLPEVQNQKPLRLMYGERLIVLSQNEKKTKEFINSLVTIFKDDVYTMGLEKYGNFPKIDEARSNHSQQTWIVMLKNFDWILKYMHQTNLRIIVLVNSCNIRIHSQLSLFTYRLCIHYQEIETVRTFLDEFHIGLLPQVKIGNTCHKMIYPVFDSFIQFSNMREEKKVYLGTDFVKQIPVFYQHTMPLLLCFVQRSKEKEVEELVEELLEQNPTLILGKDIRVIDLLKNQIFFSNPEYQEIQYDVNILWIGQGIQDYGYLLKRSIPYEREIDRIYFDGKEVKKLLYGNNETICS